MIAQLSGLNTHSFTDLYPQLSNSAGVTLEHKERISGALEDMDSQMQVRDIIIT